MITLAAVAMLTPGSAQSLEEFQKQALKLTEQQRMLEALDVVEDGLRRFPNSLELLLQQGTLLLKLGRIDEGQLALDKALQLSPEDSRILSKAAESEMRSGRLDRAIDLFRQALEKDGRDGNSHYQFAYTLFLRGADSEALREAREAVRSDPLEPRFRLFLASLLSVQRLPEEAYRELVAAYRLDPSDPSTSYRLSGYHQSRGNLGQALEFAELAHQLDPENPLYHRRLANVYRGAGEKELSRSWEKRAESLERAFLVYGHSLRLMQQGRIREASLLMEETTSKNQEFISGWTLLAQLYQKLGREHAALDAYRTVLRHKPDQRQAQEAGAFIQLRLGSLDLAVEMLRAQQDKDLNQGLLEGYQLILDQRWGEALALFSKLQEDYPLSTDLIRLMSFCASELGDQEDALKLLEKAQALQPQDPEMETFRQRLRFEKAVQFLETGQWRRASELLRKLAGEEPADPSYRLNLAYSLQQLGELADAVIHYRIGLGRTRGEVWARQNLASCLYRLQRYQEAAAEYGRLVEAGFPESRLQLGLCYSHLGRDPEAEVVFAKAVQISPTPELLYNLGITRLRLLKVDEAWKLLREAARQGYQPAAKLVRQSARR